MQHTEGEKTVCFTGLGGFPDTQPIVLQLMSCNMIRLSAF